MTRGNQRDRDREKALKAKAKQKTANTLSGSEFQRAKENNAAIMRAKQAAGSRSSSSKEKEVTAHYGVGQQPFSPAIPISAALLSHHYLHPFGRHAPVRCIISLPQPHRTLRPWLPGQVCCMDCYPG
ncbi:hypothetical protein V6Z88_003431 [Aspergillus fumigatus]